jgi:hypothetical protein
MPGSVSLSTNVAPESFDFIAVELTTFPTKDGTLFSLRAVDEN